MQTSRSRSLSVTGSAIEPDERCMTRRSGARRLAPALGGSRWITEVERP